MSDELRKRTRKRTSGTKVKKRRKSFPWQYAWFNTPSVVFYCKRSWIYPQKSVVFRSLPAEEIKQARINPLSLNHHFHLQLFASIRASQWVKITTISQAFCMYCRPVIDASDRSAMRKKGLIQRHCSLRALRAY